MERTEMIFITGGVRSGKSAFAEELASRFHQHHHLNLHYIACGVSTDAEMEQRIKKHKSTRAAASYTWTTWEQPISLKDIAGHFLRRDAVVVDCITTLLNNYLFSQRLEPQAAISSVRADINSLRERCGKLIVVSNELFQDIPYEDELTKAYQRLLGTIHQHIVNDADKAYLVEHGIRICKKGEMI